jgi:peptide/nickel transport system substrate-binding protein
MMASEDNGFVAQTEPGDGSGITRRHALQAGAAIAGAGLLAACGSSSSGSGSGSATSSTAAKALLPGAVSELAGGTPVRGGTITVGYITAGASENVWPGTASFPPDWARQYNMYNFLLYPGVNMSPLVPGLATSWETNSTATLWTFHLRPGVTWHDGSPFTAADAVYNFKLWTNPSANYAASFLTGIVDTAGVKAKDKLTVEVPLLRPIAQFPTILTWFNFGLVKNGTTAKQAAAHPIGTGPFKYVSFTPGQQSVFERNPDYWETGKPYVDKLVVASSFTDFTTLTNAFLGGSIDLYIAPPPTTAREQLAAKTMQVLLASIPSTTYMMGMRVDKGVFADNRVRQGFKLLVDRQAMLNGSLDGVGAIADDWIGVPTVPYYLTSAKPVYDPERAKSLFKAAGVSGNTYTWPTAPVAPGAVEMVTLLAEQAPAAGVNVHVQNVAVGPYFTAAGGAYTRPASINFWQPATSLMVDWLSAYTPTCPYRDTWWCHQAGGNGVPSGSSATKLINEAMAAVDPSKAADLWHECQQQQINYGGYIAWCNYPYADGAGLHVRGMKAGAGLDFNNMRFQDAWLAS